MQIDVDTLSESELIAVNQRIVSRLRLLWEIDAHNSMRGFRIGEKVSVKRAGRSPLTGVVTRYNRKTVSIVTDAGQRWNISPWLLNRNHSQRTDSRKKNVVVLLRRDKNSC